MKLIPCTLIPCLNVECECEEATSKQATPMNRVVRGFRTLRKFHLNSCALFNHFFVFWLCFIYYFLLFFPNRTSLPRTSNFAMHMSVLYNNV